MEFAERGLGVREATYSSGTPHPIVARRAALAGGSHADSTQQQGKAALLAAMHRRG